MNNKKAIYLYPLLFFVWPFGAFAVSVISLLTSKLTKSQVEICLLIVSLFLGILAFTQKSLYWDGTDCERYYFIYREYVGLSIVDAFSMIEITEILNFSFYPITVAIVSLTKNVQYMSFFWTSLTYILTFVSIKRLLKHFDYFTPKSYALISLFTLLCLMLFVHISELLKHSSAWAFFFYGLTYHLEKRWHPVCLVCTIVAIGMQPTSIMLIPLLFAHMVNSKNLLLICAIIIPISFVTDFVQLALDMLPGGAYTAMLLDKFGGGGGNESATKIYVMMTFCLALSAFSLWKIRSNMNKKLKGNPLWNIRSEKYQHVVSITLVYLLMAYINFNNLVAFLRFALFAHWLFAALLIAILSSKGSPMPSGSFGWFKCLPRTEKVSLLIVILVIAIFTKGRTIGGGYCTSYMNNSPYEIIFSTTNQYLSVKYDEK